MKRVLTVLLAGASFGALSTAGFAQVAAPVPADSADPAAQAQEANEASDNATIIVTARRRAETLIEVPQTVNAITTEDVDKFQIQDFEEVSQLVPGLTLESNNQGFGATAQVRGVNFQVTAQGSPTVEMYLNEVPVEPNVLFQATYDVGQIEVLRGPQGTLRGRPSPSGAITYTTRRPDMDEPGGYGIVSINDLGHRNLQGAVGLPIISDVLALRVAGVLDRNDAGGVRSVTSRRDPDERTRSFRATLRFEPTSNISAVVMYQYLKRTINSYGAAQFGTGAGGLVGFPNFTRPGTTGALTSVTGTCATVVGGCVLSGGNPGVFAPPNFNGPVLLESDAFDDPSNVSDVPSFTLNAYKILTGQLDWRFAGQKLSYVGGWVDANTRNMVDSDGTNTIVGTRRQRSRNSCCGQTRWSQELRLSSDERLFDMFDYTMGAFYQKIPFATTINEDLNQLLLPGAFGSPLGLTATTALGLPPSIVSPFTYDPKYTVGRINQADAKTIEKSIFANVMLHLGESTEISAGGRKVWWRREAEGRPVVTDGVVALRNPNGLGPCPATLSGPGAAGQNVINGRVLGTTYRGTCDVEVRPGNGAPLVLVPSTPFTVRKASPFVYSFSISHKFTPDLMVYANYGTSWRAGPGPVTAAPVCAAQLTRDAAGNPPPGVDPNLCQAYNFLEDEKTKGMEVGFKGAFFDRRLNLSVALYRQKFKNFFIRADSAALLLAGDCDPIPTANVQGGCTVTTGTFTHNADVTVKGIDAEASFRFSDDLNFAALFSWSKGKFGGTPVPCRDTNFDGVPDTGALPLNPQDYLSRGGPYGPTLCPGIGSSTVSPPWNLTLRGEYGHDAFPGTEAFIRGLFNYYPRNTNRPDAVSVDGPTPDRIAPKSYSLTSLWIGLRDEDRRWEITGSVRNLFNTKTVLSRSFDVTNLINPSNALLLGIPLTGTTNVPSGYRTIDFVNRREFQLAFRWNFGSR